MLETLTKIKKGMNFVLSRIAAVLLSAMTLLVLYQVFTRYVLNSPAAIIDCNLSFISLLYMIRLFSHPLTFMILPSVIPFSLKVSTRM